MSTLVPIVVEKEGGYERSYDIYSRLLKERIIFLTGPINMESANTIIAQMLFLEADDAEKDIRFYINSPGGSVSATFAIYDTVQVVKCDVSTSVVGMAASGGALLLAGGTKDKRYALPNAKVMIHQPHGMIEGQTTDIDIYAQEYIKDKEKYAEILAKHIKKSKKQILRDIERDFWLNGEGIVEYGIVDKII